MGVSFFSLDMVWLFVDCGGSSFTAEPQRAGVSQRVFFVFVWEGVEFCGDCFLIIALGVGLPSGELRL